MSEFFQFVVIGLGNGAVYAMVGMGLVVIYRSTGVLNFSQGEIAMFSTFIVWSAHEAGLPLPLALVVGMIAGAAIGAVLFRIAVQPLGDSKANPLPVVIATIGLFLAVNASASLVWGSESKPFEKLFGLGALEIGSVSIDYQKIGALAVLAVEVLAFQLLFNRTKLGLAMRSVASNPESSALAGVPVNRVLLAGWGLAAAIGAVAGTFTAPNFGIDANLMLNTLVFAFAAIALGGFDSLIGAVVGGLIVGILTDVAPRYIDAIDKMPLAPAFLLIVAVLLFRPEGLFGTRRVQRV